MQYNALVEDHFRRPRNAADSPCALQVCGEAGSVERGTWLLFQLDLDGREIERARFRAYGCPYAIALGSWLTEHLPGRTLTRTFTLDRENIVAELALPIEKSHCVIVAEDALRACAARLEAGDGA